MMHYEEKISEGKLHFRSTPHGEWILICYEKLLDRLIKAENELGETQEELDRIISVLLKRRDE